ncbi:uncharacterized protein A1O9_11659 [Exophiala aquamarina CBS 119918]|uniref:Major facilitator superfamily (MFS) profile domain-containing protein n=1 Tax=Exophiala aquamarina CBS 119918 TaxID=1182545 RepID=A0A072NZG2_9EURO|nr:uncharacterized protein A1O9_11659 [Exophiala aquamarina CBS 119918]KEF52418.1 hypothetical protein A1O9_11659 [Exophiala aquamarina CBS 119918]
MGGTRSDGAKATTDDPQLFRNTTNDTQYFSALHLFGISRSHAILFSLYLTMFLTALDITIVGTALPEITSQFEASAAQYTWVGSSYTLASTSTTPLWAGASDVFGRKPVLMAANLAFLVGSTLAGSSTSIGMLIAGRTIQCFGGGGLLILNTIVIADLFEFKDRAKYYGFTGVIFAVSSAIVYINLPLEGISLVVLTFFFKLKKSVRKPLQSLMGFDWLGGIGVLGGTISFLLGLESGASVQHSWKSAYTLGLVISGLVILVLSFLWEWKCAKQPLIPIKVLVGRSNLAALGTALGHSIVFISYDFYLPLYFQTVLHTSPIISGLYLLALILPLSIMSFVAGLYIRKTNKYCRASLLGSILMTLGTGLFISFGSTTNFPKIFLYQIIAGIGGGVLFLSPMMALQAHLSPENIAAALSGFTFLRNLGTASSIVVGGVILQKGLGTNTLTTGHGGVIPTGITKEKYTSALRILLIFYTSICGVMLLASLLIAQKEADAQHVGQDNLEQVDMEIFTGTKGEKA